MPVVTLDVEEIRKLVNSDINVDSIKEAISKIGADVGEFKEGKLSVEFFPDRPDLLSEEGVARALKGIFEIEVGVPDYSIKDGNVELFVDESTKNVRPFIGCAIVKNVKLNNRLLEGLMGFQELLHWAVGRDRKRAAIGVHDISKVKPPFFYEILGDDIKFVPLQMDMDMTPSEILKKHPKGTKYSKLVAKDLFPIIRDSDGQVLSFPPIINGELTKVTENTKELFIEVTGTHETSVKNALNILVTAFIERGFEIESVNVNYYGKNKKYPDLNPRKEKLSIEYTKKILGIELSREEIKKALLRMRYSVEERDREFEVIVPCYRADILHEVDMVEDVGIGYGIERIVPKYPSSYVIAREHKAEEIKQIATEILTGLGFLEVMTLMITGEEVELNRMKRMERVVKTENPITKEHSIIRNSLLPSLLEILSLNKHRDMPQRIFEVGEAIVIEKEPKTVVFASGVITHSRANFTEIKSYVEAFLNNMGMEFEIEEGKTPYFIDGRCAKILSTNMPVGYFGEVDLEVIEKFSLEYPVVGFEIKIFEF